MESGGRLNFNSVYLTLRAEIAMPFTEERGEEEDREGIHRDIIGLLF